MNSFLPNLPLSNLILLKTKPEIKPVTPDATTHVHQTPQPAVKSFSQWPIKPTNAPQTGPNKALKNDNTPYCNASVVFGIPEGIANLAKGKFGKKQFVKYALYNLVAYAMSWLVVAPVGDVFIYNEPTDKLMLQASFSFIADYLVALVIGGLLCYAYAKTIAKPNSLDKE